MELREQLQDEGQHGSEKVMTSEGIISTNVDRIVARFQPSRVVLVGSRALGGAGRLSDVNPLVVMASAPDKRRAAVEILRSLRDLTVSKDMLVTTRDEIATQGRVVGTVHYAALGDGKVLYERS